MSNLYVVKFGGSSVATTARIKHVADIVAKLVLDGNKVVVVTSAMQGVTNQLIDFTKSFQDYSFNREYDAVISSGEVVASGLLALCLQSIGINSKSLNCWQIPIKVSGVFSNAFIESVNKTTILNEIEKGVTPVIAGFQGLSTTGDVMTIGRGGSDATACAVSHAINADECFIYTDVDGVYSADPRIVLNSKRLSKISYDEMLELASSGAKVLQSKSVLIAKQCNVKLRVLSSFHNDGGKTIVAHETVYIPKDKNIAGISHKINLSKVTIIGNFDILSLICKINNPEFISINDNCVSFLFPKTSFLEIRSILDETPYISFEFDNDIGVITIVGHGIKTDSSILNDVISKISANGIKIKQIIASEISISTVVQFQQTENVLNLLHKHFFEK